MDGPSEDVAVFVESRSVYFAVPVYAAHRGSSRFYLHGMTAAAYCEFER